MNIQEKICNFVVAIVNIRATYAARVAENHKALIRGSVLDPDNHPSTDMKVD